MRVGHLPARSFAALLLAAVSLVAAPTGDATYAAPRLARGAVSLSNRGPGQNASQASTSLLLVDAAVSLSDGTPLAGVSPDDFTVLVDGRRRPVLEVRRLFRGPGALASATAFQNQGRGAADAEGSRLVLLAIDTSGLEAGADRSAATIAALVLDRLGPEDRVAVTGIPSAQTSIVFTVDHAAHREALRGVTGTPLDAEVTDLKMSTPEALQIARGDRSAFRTVLERYDEDERPSEGTIEDRAAHVLGQVRERGQMVFRALSSIAATLKQNPERKTTILLSAGEMAVPDAEIVDRTARDAFDARMAVHVLRLSSPQHTETRALETLAKQTGGSFRPIGRRGEAQAVERLARELATLEVLSIAGEPDADARPRGIAVTTSRRGASVRAAVWIRQRTDVNVGLTRPAAAAEKAASPVPEPPSGRRPPAPDPELDLILERAADYVAAFFGDFSAAVAEEEYVQRTPSTTSFGHGAKRVLRSDLLLVRRPDTGELMPFRDVFEVDGTPLRDRQERLQRLFLETPVTAMKDALRIAEESARYNLGPIDRTVNVPTLPLQFLQRRYQRRLEFKKARQEVVDGRPVWRVDYLEQGRPTLIRTKSGKDGEDMPAEGSFWIDATTGRVVRTRLHLRRRVDAEFDVIYRPNDVLGVWVPAEMKESYTYGSGNSVRQIFATAKYSNFRRFRVTTEEKVTVPK